MEYRFTNSDDYDTLVEFWKWHRFPAPKFEMLPNEMRDGIAVIQDNVILTAGFLYRTPSTFCFLEFIVSNPAIKDRKIREESINLLIEVISNVAKKMNFKIMFTFVKNDNLINKLKNNDFITGSHSFEMVKIL